MVQKTILIIDDEIDILENLQEALELEQYNVIRARDAFEALKTLNTQVKPDLIMSDIMMPKMSGYEFHKKIMGEEGLKDIPVILMSAGPLKTEEFDSGLFIKKPFDLFAMLDMVAKVIGDG